MNVTSTQPSRQSGLPQGSEVSPDRVFVVTGFDSEHAVEGEAIAHYVIADDDRQASAEVAAQWPGFVAMGSATLAELKRHIVRLEAVRRGLVPPTAGHSAT